MSLDLTKQGQEKEGSGPSEKSLVKKPKKQGSFWITEAALDILITEQATANQVCAYLLLSKHTDEEGYFTTAGIQSLKDYIGIGDEMANKAIEALVSMGLVCYPWKWNKEKDKPAIPGRPTGRSQVRYVLMGNYFDDLKVWFSNELIEGYGKFKNPLKKLKRLGDVAARLLLLIYKGHDMENYGGLKPCGNFSQNYKIEPETKKKGYTLWKANPKGMSGNSDIAALAILGKSMDGSFWKKEKGDLQSENEKSFWRAIEALTHAGFIYEVVTVFDGKMDNPEAQPIYTIDVRNIHGHKPKGEEGLLKSLHKAAEEIWGLKYTDTQGRFAGTYPVIVQAGIVPEVIGVYRVRFRVTNPKNFSVKQSWSRIYQCDKEAQSWINDLFLSVEPESTETATQE